LVGRSTRITLLLLLSRSTHNLLYQLIYHVGLLLLLLRLLLLRWPLLLL
jgi:hypothetical protein